ncbi:CU044_2847 family protein [Streptomyces sp. NBC_01304]|uniref:CU044_2847 family protein n=1 Tax=Streptomyces sp. NBC_01304 TaxID=2903818 RepID=UPI002E111D6A|nr:hypothetical protein OG430_12775 [Streptomyces sp. NBC_01304]
MGQLVRFELGDGETVVVNLDDADRGVVDAASATDLVGRATGSFSSALDEVRGAAVLAMHKLRDIPKPPDEVTIEFGIQLDAEVGAVLARTGVQGHLQVQLVWRKESAAGTAENTGGTRAPEGSGGGNAVAPGAA